MSDHSQQNEQGQRPAEAAKTGKRRSPVERALVWAVICLLIVVAGLEGWSRYGYTRSVRSLQAALAENDKTGKEIPLAEVDRVLYGTPILAGVKRDERRQYVRYTWWSLVRDYEIELTAETDDDPAILSLETGNAPPPKKLAASGDAEDGADDEAAVEGGSPAGPGDGGSDAGAPGGRGGSGRSGGRRGRASLLGLLEREAVQQELKLADEQVSQIGDLAEEFGSAREAFGDLLGQLREADEEERQSLLEEIRLRRQERRDQVLAALQDVLEPEQFDRFRQLFRRERGISALRDASVAAELELTDDQKTRIAEVLNTASDRRRELFRQARSGELDRSEVRGQMASLRDEAEAEALSVLAPEQKEAWQKLLGEPLEAEPEGAGRPDSGSTADAAEEPAD